MERFKRAVSLVLCMVMVLGLLPVSVFAETGDTHYLMFATDRHTNTSIIGNIINNMETNIGENALEYLALGGDMVGSGSSHPEYDSSEVLSEATGATTSLSAANVDIVAGIHDMNVNDDAGIVLPYQGGGAQIYAGDGYYVYGVEEFCISEDSNESNWSSEAQKFVDWANGDGIDKSAVIFVSSHYPLHANRDDNDGAYYWHQALNTVATGGDDTVERDIVFFHGHNHTVDKNEYVYNVGDTMSIQNGNSTVSEPIYYTYATAGYLNQNSKATLVTLTDEQIVLEKYTTSGSSAMTTVNRAVTETQPTVNTVSCSGMYGETENLDTITATGTGLTGVEAVWNEDFDLTGYDETTTTVYDVALTGYTEGEVTLVFDLNDQSIADKKVWTVAADGTLTEVAFTAEDKTVDGVAHAVFTVTAASATGTYLIGKEPVEAEAVLTGISVTSQPEITSYTLVTDIAADGNLYLDLTGLVVTAAYDNGQTEELYWDQFDESKNGYALGAFDLYTPGTQTITVTYGDFETSFDVVVYENTAEDAAEAVASAVSGVLKEGYVAQDITVEGYTQGDEIKVIMTAPEGADTVYHVDENNALEEIPDAAFVNGTVVFTTDHFSTYVVGESTEITVDDPETATGTGDVTTTTTKTVYVLTSSISSGNEYLIVNSNSASSTTRYALANNSGSVAATGVTVKSGDVDGDGDSETYIELEDAADELWTVGSGYTFKNSSYYLGYTTSGNNWNQSYTFGLSTTSRNWSYSSNRLSTSVGSWESTTYYLRYNDGWTWSSSNSASGRSVYFYQKTEVEVETTTTMSGTYSIAGEDVTKVVAAAGATAELSSTLTFTPDSGSATTTDTSATATYTLVEGGDPNGVISGISGNTVTFSGAYGKALVKVSYTTAFGEVTNYITVTASEPYYTLDITKGGDVVTGTTISQKGVTSTTTLRLGTQISYTTADDTETLDALPEGATLTWHIPAEYQNIATVDDSGLVSFKGVDGAFYVTATLTVGGKDYTVGVNISATTSQYSVPSDGAEDFPEYPNEGAIRYDKTATAVGNFSETGIAQVELSMTGVPYTTDSEIDVVVMLDMTGSMTDDSMAAAEAAALAFAKQIILNADGTYNNNRISVQIFNKNGVTELWKMSAVTADTYDSLVTAIESASTKQASGGTPYSTALSGCKDILDAARTDGVGNDRQQFCVFVSDGTPTSYTDVDGGSDTTKKEYYSSQMQEDGVTVYGVYTSAAAGSSGSNGSGGSVNDLEEGTAIMQNVASSDDKVYVVEDYTDTSALTGVFTSIAMDILQAATDVTVEDKVAEDYTMIFDIPTGSQTITGVTNDFYIEFLKYTLDSNHERVDSDSDGDTYDDATSITKLYLGVSNGSYYAASDASGTAYAAPVFEEKTIGDKGTLYYWTTDSSLGDTGISVTVSGTTYYFVSYGLEEGYNMTSGAFASGKIDSATNMSEDLLIATPYFVYNAATRMLYWTVDKLDATEYALRYFLYLDNSATEVGTSNETEMGPYPTNDHAYITYTNFNGNDCRQVFPVPQLTWNGAQVSYVFYLVNAAGQPINKSGQIVDFANATFITDVYTTSVVWNKSNDDTSTGKADLSIDWLASELLPTDYIIYDVNAGYELDVYEEADGETILNQFTIKGDTAANISASLNERLNLSTTTASEETTKVYNTKAGRKISAYGTYTSDMESMAGFDFCNTTVAFAVVWQPKLVPDVVVVDYGLDVLINVVDNDILQNKVSGIGVGADAYGSTEMNTGVSTTSKLGTAALTIDGNTISIENEKQIRFHQGDMVFNDYVEFFYESPVEFWEGSDPKEGYMYSSVTVIPATSIYYEDSFVELKSYTWNYDADTEADQDWINSTDFTGESATLNWEGHQWATEGQTYTGSAAVQDTDRPGDKSLLGDDANNLYGYDSHYDNCSKYSLGSAAKINVDYDNYGEVGFTFAGTGFDVISMTSNKTGTILVTVYDQNGNVATCADGTTCKLVVDTYYGYARKYVKNVYTYTDGEWTVVSTDVEALGESQTAPENPTEGATFTTYSTKWYTVDSNDPNALYQVPVMKVEGLTYGTYSVVIEAMYDTAFDHDQYADGSYDFYLDAIRIYDPANDGADDSTIENAYQADGEYLPEYYELRNWLISRETFYALDANTTIEGVAFVGVTTDGTASGSGTTASVEEYNNYGPNNELYLAPGQAVAFMLNGSADAPEGYEVESVQIAMKSVGGTAAVKLWGAGSDTVSSAGEMLLETATDLYYDITDLDNKTVVIMNSGTEASSNEESGTGAHAILSITNVKVTYKLPNENSGTDAQSVQNELKTASFGTIGAAQTYAVAAAAETETETVTDVAPFTVNVAAVEMALASIHVDEEREPETTEPETTEPEATEPETTEPETTEPETTEPEATEPEATEPETTEPETTEPEVTEPEATEPEGDSGSESAIGRLIGWIIGLIGKIFG